MVNLSYDFASLGFRCNIGDESLMDISHSNSVWVDSFTIFIGFGSYVSWLILYLSGWTSQGDINGILYYWMEMSSDSIIWNDLFDIPKYQLLIHFYTYIITPDTSFVPSFSILEYLGVFMERLCGNIWL